MWYALIILLLGIFVTYVIGINLEKAFHRIGKKKEKEKKNTFVSRRERMRTYNKRN